MDKKRLLLVFSLMLAISLAQLADSRDIGVSPPYVQINFEPNLKQNLNFMFTGDIGSEYEIYVEGDLQEYIGLSKERIYGPESVTVYLELPEKIDVPGAHKMKISIREVIPEGSFQGMIIRGDVKATLVVNVPYPGKYLDVEFSASDAKYGEFSEINLKLISKGEEDLTAKVKIDIYDNQDNLVDEIDLGEHYIKSQEEKEFNKKWDTIGNRAGAYKAVAIVDYEDNVIKKESIFKVGELIIKIVGHSNNFVRRIINRFDVEIESLWNDPIEGVYAEILIPNYDIKFKTVSETVIGFGKMNLTGYFDPTPIDKDVFFGSITVFYGDKKIKKLVNFEMQKEIDYGRLLMIAGIILVVILIAILLYILLLKKEADKELKKKKRMRKK